MKNLSANGWAKAKWDVLRKQQIVDEESVEKSARSLSDENFLAYNYARILHIHPFLLYKNIYFE
ncbi:hypothetical protein G3A_15645 [Bacillus sp. 17376]|nr:hypothetical protein G3A_15645 [Bacillus sp. 17376]